MAKKKAPKQAAPAAAKSEAVSSEQESRAPTKPKRAAARAKRAPSRAKRASARARRGGTKRPRRAARPRKAARKAVSKAAPSRRVRRGRSSKRIRYTDQQRQRILATAKREGLSALKVKKRFGVTPVTYYAWLRKSGAMPAARRGRPPVNGRRAGFGLSVGDADLARLVRRQVREQIHQMLPEIVTSEVNAVFSGLVGPRRRRRG